MRSVSLLFLLPLTLLFRSLQVTAQANLVPNDGFEVFSFCPVGFSQYSGYVSNWLNPNASSPDYMNSCANPNPAGVPTNGVGYQQPHSGTAYSGIYTSSGTIYREFIQVPLLSPLSAGQDYIFSMYVVLHNKSSSAVDDVGAYFSATAPTSGGTGMLSGSPLPQIGNPYGSVITDTLNWTLITGTYTAAGGEQFLTIGHLKSDVNTTYQTLPYGNLGAYYYIDDVSLYEVTLLPVTLQSFSGTLVKGTSGNTIGLKWSTASEENNCCFLIERSNDAKSFSLIGTVPAAGHSVTTTNYSFTDPNPLPGDNYYRLRQQDLAEEFAYSQTIMVANSSEESVPVVITGEGTLNFQNLNGETLNAILYSTEGRQTGSKIISSANAEWNLRQFPQGIYLLLLQDPITQTTIIAQKIFL